MVLQGQDLCPCYAPLPLNSKHLLPLIMLIGGRLSVMYRCLADSIVIFAIVLLLKCECDSGSYFIENHLYGNSYLI